MRATALLTVSLPSSFARQVQKVAKEEARPGVIWRAVREAIDEARAVDRGHRGRAAS